MLKFIHCADLHLDRPCSGLATIDPELAARLRQAPGAALDRIVELAIREQVDFVLIAGDVWDQKEKSLTARLFFNTRMRRLAEAGIACFYVGGNHDPLTNERETLPLPDNVHCFGGRVGMVPFYRDGKEVAHLYGISFTRAAETANLSLQFVRQNPEVPAIAILHCNIGNTGHDNYAPAAIDDLCRAGMDYWALGHVHRFQVLREQAPAIVYPGCAQGGSPRETGAHGCCLVTIDAAGRVKVDFHPMDVIRFATREITATAAADWETAIGLVLAAAREEAAGSDRDLVLRCLLTGRTGFDAELRRDDSREAARQEINARLADTTPLVRVERLTAVTHGVYDREELARGSDFAAELIALYRSAAAEPEMLAELRRELDAVLVRFTGAPLPEDEFGRVLDAALDRSLNLLADGGE
ncbi:MAG: DNA repair exonuclease [Victivallales bacterium]|nr:DNA repair exonuclease [Victivallales bacterium]